MYNLIVIELKKLENNFIEELSNNLSVKIEEGNNGFSSYYKTNKGMIFLLENYVIFLAKPTILIKNKNIKKKTFYHWNN